jgi:hypothetical protein
MWGVEGISGRGITGWEFDRLALARAKLPLQAASCSQRVGGHSFNFSCPGVLYNNPDVFGA